MIFGHDANTSTSSRCFHPGFKKMDHVYLNVNEGLIQMFDFIEQSGNIDWDDGRFRNDDVVG